MKKQVEEILEKLNPSIAIEGGKIELSEIQDDGTLCLIQTEDCANSETIVWTHRVRAERAIRELFPETVFKIDLTS